MCELEEGKNEDRCHGGRQYPEQQRPNPLYIQALESIGHRRTSQKTTGIVASSAKPMAIQIAMSQVTRDVKNALYGEMLSEAA